VLDRLLQMTPEAFLEFTDSFTRATRGGAMHEVAPASALNARPQYSIRNESQPVPRSQDNRRRHQESLFEAQTSTCSRALTRRFLVPVSSETAHVI
jgi:hypothetical protein